MEDRALHKGSGESQAGLWLNPRRQDMAAPSWDCWASQATHMVKEGGGGMGEEQQRIQPPPEGWAELRKPWCSPRSSPRVKGAESC